MKIRWRNIAICLVLVGLSFLLVLEFTSELLAFAWHARHGMNAQLNGPRHHYEVPIPVSWYPVVDEGGWRLSVHHEIRRGLGHSEVALMSVSVSPLGSTAEELRQSAKVLQDRLGITTTEVTELSYEGGKLQCFERKSERGEAAAIARAYGLTQIECVPIDTSSGISGSFQGSRTLVPSFYELLRRVRSKPLHP